MKRTSIAFAAAALAVVAAPFISEGTVRLSFTENYTPPSADEHSGLFIHIDASDLSMASYDADINGNLRLASIADPRGNGLYASNSLAPYNKATIKPCALNGRSVLDLGALKNAASAADLRWFREGAYANCNNEIDAFIVYANRTAGEYADPFSHYGSTSFMWRNGGEYTLFCTNATGKAHDNLTKATNIFIDGEKTGNLVKYPDGFHLMYVHNSSGYSLPLNGVGAERNILQGGMLVAEIYVFDANVFNSKVHEDLMPHLMKKWGVGDVEPYAPPALSGITASMNANGLESLALAGGALAPGNGGTATISVPAGFAPREGDYPLLTGASLSEDAAAALETWTVTFSPAIDAAAKLAVSNGNVVLRVMPKATVISMR